MGVAEPGRGVLTPLRTLPTIPIMRHNDFHIARTATAIRLTIHLQTNQPMLLRSPCISIDAARTVRMLKNKEGYRDPAR